MITEKAWQCCKDMLRDASNSMDDAVVAGQARCAIPMLVAEIDELREIVRTNAEHITKTFQEGDLR